MPIIIAAQQQDDHAHRDPEDGRGVVEHGLHEGGRDDREDDDEEDGQAGDDVA